MRNHSREGPAPKTKQTSRLQANLFLQSCISAAAKNYSEIRAQMVELCEENKGERFLISDADTFGIFCSRDPIKSARQAYAH